jgi:hypothetical protein
VRGILIEEELHQAPDSLGSEHEFSDLPAQR